MTRPKTFAVNRQIRFSEELWVRIEEYRIYCLNKTGVENTHSDIIRALINEALNNKGIVNEPDET